VLEYAQVLSSFHFINRIADLLEVPSEALPAPLRRVEGLRKLSVWIASRIMSRMDLAIRAYEKDYDQALESISPVYDRALGRVPGDDLAPLRSRPALIEVLQLAFEERDERSSLDRDTLARVHAAVLDAMPSRAEDTMGFHPRPDDPVEAFAFVGTRYAARTTQQMIDALRAAGYDDLAILDLAIAIADANMWLRLHRLTGLRADIYFLATDSGTARHAVA